MLTLINTNRMVPAIGPIGLDYVARAATEAGLEVVNTYSVGGIHQVVVRCTDPQQLDSLARRPDVRNITPELGAMTR